MIDGWMNNAPVRSVNAKVELYNGSTLVDTIYQWGILKEITIERVGESGKFFGFGICQKMNIRLLDINKSLNITTANSFRVCMGDYFNVFPIFYVTEVNRDENTGELSITAYDALFMAGERRVEELNIADSYSLDDFINACVDLLGINFEKQGFSNAALDIFNLYYEQGANFEGSESIREALTAAAEAAQCIMFINKDNNLVFKRLNPDEVCLNIDKADYYTLKSGNNRKLSAICATTELGDSVTASISAIGTTQYIRDNPFLELREDLATILINAINDTQIGGLTINQFDCDWRGNYLLELGDCITLTTKENKIVTSFLLDDIITYNGGYNQKSKWEYKEGQEGTDENPATLGDALNHTFARVDKVNKKIQLVAGESEGNSAAIAALQLDTQSIVASIEKSQTAMDGAIDNLNENVAVLTNKVEAQITSEDINIAINSALDDGVNKVVTTTGYKLDDEGLTISKNTTDLSTTISDNGMSVSKNNEVVLTANDYGVDARNLRATTYLIIGGNSRLEDYDKNGESRTGCFWIGG